ncbi:hypothetical protein ACFQX7_39985 [Luedemannella flava]
MTWLVWRQHRAEALVLALLVAALGVVVVVLAGPLHALFPRAWPGARRRRSTRRAGSASLNCGNFAGTPCRC